MAGNGAGAGRPGGGSQPAMPRLVGHYQLGDEIGKGGFGTVFKGLNVKTGDFVAIKRMSLRNVDMDEIQSMQSEINLLKQLNHPNIVKYVDTITTEDCLHIVLEYVEGGSLAHTLKKFGAFSEELAAIYIAQVLDGLAYLHEQGVIHRDIKGANILVTKDGLVKLADFGVAISTQEKSNTVVGSPYWMAPEIIEMAGTTTACDIWSVGCTIVELITTKPPYFDLRPMTALFRIVSDDYPPLPDHCSDSLHDFLVLCFKKEPSFRKSASALLNEQWVRSRLKRVRPLQGRSSDMYMPQPVVPGPGGGAHGAAPASQAEVDEFEESLTNTIKATQLKFLPPQQPQQHPAAVVAAAAAAALPQPGAPAPAPRDLLVASDDDDDFGAGLELDANFRGGGGLVTSQPAWGDNTEAEEALEGVDQDSWGSGADDDAFGGPQEAATPVTRDSFAVFLGHDHRLARYQEDDAEEGDWGDIDVANALPAPGDDGPLSAARGDGEDAGWGSDDDDDDDGFGDAAFPASGAGRSPVARGGGAADSQLRLSRFQDEDDDDDDGWGDVDVASAPLAGRAGAIPPPASPPTALTRHFLTPEARGPPATSPFTTDVPVDALRERMQRQMREQAALGDDDDDDPFAAMSSDDDSVGAVRRSRSRPKEDSLMALIARLSHEEPDHVIVGVCEDLSRLLLDNPDGRDTIIPNHGVLPFVDILEEPGVSSRVLASVLRVVNLFTRGDRRLQEAVALVGVLPAILRLAHPSVATVVRMHVADFVQQLCTTSTVTLQIFVAVGGVQVLVHLLQPTTSDEAVDDVWSERVDGAVLQRMRASSAATAVRRIALAGINSVFELHTVPKNDFCRLFVKAGILDALAVNLRAMNTTIVSAFAASVTPRGGGGVGGRITPLGSPTGLAVAVPAGNTLVDEAFVDLHLVADLAITFCQADHVVAMAVADHPLLSGLLRLLRPVIPSLVDHTRYASVLVKLQRALKHLSMEPGTLHALQSAGAIATLVPFLGMASDDVVKPMHNHVMHALFNLCKVNKPRQEAACFAGIVPHLQRLIAEQGPLKQLALPLLCDMAHNVSSRRVRDVLWRHGTVEFYFQVLSEHYWQIPALNSISMCLQHDAARVQEVMLRPTNLLAIISLFQTPQRSVFESLLAPLQSMLERCAPLARALAHSLFVAELVHRLTVTKAIVLTSLLKMLLCVFEASERPWEMLVEHSLVAPVTRLARNDRMVVVRGIAQRLLRQFQPVVIAKVTSSLNWE